MFPQFLGIGAQKAGTTWLHAMLSAHEDVWLPHLKELHYFDRKFPIHDSSQARQSRKMKGVVAWHVSKKVSRLSLAKVKERLRPRRLSDLTWEFRYVFGDWSDEWYSSLFDNTGGRVSGEITPAYACLGEAAIAHVYKLMPEAKLILLLRDPIDRAWSHAKMDLTRAGSKDAADIDDAAFITHFNSPASRRRGDYMGCIDRWLAQFSEEQLFLGFYDEILSSPEDLLKRIYSFLGVSASDANVPSAVHARVNTGRAASIPPHLHRHLAALYVDELRALAGRFGTYPQAWLEKCEARLACRND